MKIGPWYILIFEVLLQLICEFSSCRVRPLSWTATSAIEVGAKLLLGDTLKTLGDTLRILGDT